MEKLTLKELISKTEKEMSKCGYSDKTIYSAYSYIWVKLYNYNSPNEIFDEEVIKKFLYDYFKKDLFQIEKNHLLCVERMYIKAFSMIIKVNNGEKIESIKKEIYHMNDKLQKIYDKYMAIAKNNGNVSRTITNKEKVINLFISRSDFNNPSEEKLINYLDKCNKTKKAITNTIDNRMILHFLTLCYEEKYISLSILNTWPNSFPNRSCSNIPSQYSTKEIKELLTTAYDFQYEDCHLRNYAILCLIAYTGLRASDVCNLKFSDINWNDCKINIIQQKTQKALLLPLISQIGNPIVNYITKERPKTSIDNIFVTEKGKKMIPQIIATIVNRYFRASNININDKHYGAHSLRHSVASTLINKGTPIYDIAKTLGHSDTRCVSIYAKVNMSNLKKCVLEDLNG